MMKSFLIAVRLSLFAFALVLATGLTAKNAHAQQDTQDYIPVSASASEATELPPIPVDPTHPPIKITPDKSEIIHLDRPAQTIIVGNEAHAAIMMDTATRLVIVPRNPGATYFTAIDENGRVVMQRHVIVSNQTERAKYVRVRRGCNELVPDCQPQSVYYCPGGCHSIMLPSEEDDSDGGAGGAPLPTGDGDTPPPAGGGE